MDGLQQVCMFAQFAAGLVLLLAGFAKLADWRGFGRIVRDFRILPEAVSAPVAWLVPVAEVAVGAALLDPAIGRAASPLAAALFLLFAGAVSINLVRGRRDLACGCFGSDQRQGLHWGIVFRNIVFAALACAPALGGATAAPAMEERLAMTVAALTVLAALSLARLIVRLWPRDEGWREPGREDA